MRVSDNMQIFILAILLFSVNCAESQMTCCKRILKDANNKVVTDVQEACKSKPCVTKCCDIDHYLYYNKTTEVYGCLHKDKFKQHMDVSEITFDFSDYPIYKSIEEINETKSDKDFLKDYNLLVNEVFQLQKCKIYRDSPTRMLEDGRMYKYNMIDNTTYKTENLPEYCVEKWIYRTVNQTRFKYRTYELIQDDNKNNTVFRGIAMLISAFFMGLVLLVYSILKQLRNIQGLILMGYIATFFVCYVLRAALMLGLAYCSLSSKACTYLTPFSYVSELSIFFWMNVMSFDIWWTFRATRKVRSIHRQGELMKFMWYGLFAWGTPSAMAIIVYCFNKQYYVVCGKCKDHTKLVFIPILIMTVINTLLFLLTVYNMWLIKRAMSDFDLPSQGKIQTNRNRFWLYIKISLIMGATWILELISLWLEHMENIPEWLKMLLDTPNLFIGVAMFIVFVFKKSIFNKLSKRLNNKNTSSIGRNSDFSGSSTNKTKNMKSTN